jgi:hypothetical protein
VLHSVAVASATAHITPVSELIVASLTGQSPAVYYGAFAPDAPPTLTTAQVGAATARVVSVLSSGGIDFSAFGNLLTAPLVAASGSEAGNAYDQALDALGLRLTDRGLTLAQLSESVARSSPANSTATATAPALPPQALLQPASATCAALRSGTYRYVALQESSLAAQFTGTFALDAVNGTITTDQGQISVFGGVGGCVFDSGFGQFAVSPAGVLVGHVVVGGVTRLQVAFPEQRHDVADLAGAWHDLAFDLDTPTGNWELGTYEWTFSPTGGAAVTHDCDEFTSCEDTPPNQIAAVTNNPDGGFDYLESDGWRARFFAYRAGNGGLMLVSGDQVGTLGFFTRRGALAPVAAGSRERTWNVRMRATGQLLNEGLADFTVTAVNGSDWTRVSNLDGHLETLALNQPRDGWVTRAPNLAGPGAVERFYGLEMRGMGLSVRALGNIDGGAYGLSVVQP